MKYPTAYTIARWRVTIGQEEAFRAAWRALADVFAELAQPPLDGTLLQHDTDTTLFVSVGAWNSQDDIGTMKRDPAAQDAFLRVTALCDETDWGGFSVVERVDLQAAAAAALAAAVVVDGHGRASGSGLEALADVTTPVSRPT